MTNTNLNPKFKKLNQLILNLLEIIQKEKSSKNIILQYLEAINKELRQNQTDKLINNNLDNFNNINDFIHKNTSQNNLTKKNIKIILKQYNKIIKNINYKENKLKKFAIATTLLAALGFGTHITKNNIEQPQIQVQTQEKISEEIIRKLEQEKLYQKYNINSKFYNTQKDEIIKTIQTFQTEEKILKHLNNLNIYNPKTNTLTPSNFNQNLYKYYQSLSQSENINFKLLILITTVESSFGDQRISHSGALGPLQAMPATIKENCYQKYRNQFKNDEEFYKDLGVQLKAGIYELQKIAKGYNINISQNSNPNKSDLIMISASYNAGYGFFKKYPNQINNPTTIKGKEVYGYIRKVLTLNQKVKKIQ